MQASWVPEGPYTGHRYYAILRIAGQIRDFAPTLELALTLEGVYKALISLLFSCMSGMESVQGQKKKLVPLHPRSAPSKLVFIPFIRFSRH